MRRVNARGLVFIAGIFVFTALCQVSARAQTNDFSLRLSSAKFPFVPKEYYISKTFDIREDKSSIGHVIIPGSSSASSRQTVDFNGKADDAFGKFISMGLQRKTELRPVNISLKKLKITEAQQGGGLVNGAVEIVLLFETDAEVPLKLLEYKGGTRYTRSIQQVSAIEPVMSNTLINAVKYFNSWIDREADTNEKLARKLKLSFREVSHPLKSDTAFYSANRRLTWSDFKSIPDKNSRFAAEIFPFFSFEQNSSVVDGTIHVNIVPKVYMVKSFSWVKDHARNAFTLNHEQRHFDIVKIAAERFRKKIAKEMLTVDNYQGILSVEYLQILREMNALQKEYDNDTKHGTDMASQNRWNSRIDSEIRSYLTASGTTAQRR